MSDAMKKGAQDIAALMARSAGMMLTLPPSFARTWSVVAKSSPSRCWTVPALVPAPVAAAVTVAKQKAATAPGSMIVAPTSMLSGASVSHAAASSSQSSLSKRDTMQQWARDNRNVNTSRTYDAGWNGFAKYMQEHAIASKSALKAEDIADYLRVHLEVDGLAASSHWREFAPPLLAHSGTRMQR